MFEHIHAHLYTAGNRKLLEKSDLCGCIGCRWVYEASEIDEWHHEDENGVGQTAICARCNIDGVVPDDAGYLLNWDFMTRMNNYWLQQVHEYTPEEIVKESTIESLNRSLWQKGFRIEINDERKPERYYLLYEGKEEFYFTKNPKELLIKIAQLIPDSDVIIETKEITEGDEKILKETMLIRIHQQTPRYEKDEN
jgi:hypothetical protein